MRSTPRSLPSLRTARRARIGLTMLVVAALAVLVTVVPAAWHASASTVPPAPPGWSTVFSDGFSGAAGSRVDSQWTYDTGTQYNGSGCAANWGTGEVESNTNSTANVSLDGSGHLNLTPVKSGGSCPTPTHTPTPTPTPTPSPTPTGRQCTATAAADISADCYSGSQGSISVTAATGDTNPSGVDGNQVAQLASGDYLEYPGINFGTGSSQFDARVASGAAGGVSGLVEVVLDNPSNAPVGSFAVGNTGGWSSWRTVPANITKVTGTHNVYLEFSSGASGDPPYVSLHYFNFPVS